MVNLLRILSYKIHSAVETITLLPGVMPIKIGMLFFIISLVMVFINSAPDITIQPLLKSWCGGRF
ncbi:hypothetical protein [Foetidibacter luteolus]|uniref:hypothetical protein n=1 Tax=Foetidibacter luteolus TaxID=2608880 RepID=UPI001A9938F1|nr:hypothetical protein [Foetidibacter luteolus]